MSGVFAAGLTKTFGHGASATLALDHVDLSVANGEFLCIVGASGCGKSTLLNLLAGLERPSSGDVSVDGRVSMMFQQDALFPWLTVRANIECGLRIAGRRSADRREVSSELLETVRLTGFGDRRPHELSGGMRQRVALARALAMDADVLLMDEPFGALDAMTRDLMHDELERIWAERRLSIVFVTHNVREAVRLGDRVALFSSRPGRLIEVFHVPFDRPRRIESPEVSELAGTITGRLRGEVARHVDA